MKNKKQRKPFYEPCPSCGNFPTKSEIPDAHTFAKSFRVFCVNWHCESKPQTEKYPTWREARVAWNKQQIAATCVKKTHNGLSYYEGVSNS